MRRAKFKIYEDLLGGGRGYVEYTGIFHQWGSEVIEFESGGVSQTVAIMEVPSGKIMTPCPENVQFLDTNI